MNRRALAVIVVLLAALAACGPVNPTGPDGTVTSHQRARYRLGWHYWLTVTTTDGHTHKFRVRVTDYRHCADGSHYPQCTKRGTR